MGWVCMSEWDELLTDKCNTFEEHVCNIHKHSYSLLLFIGILGPPTFLLRRLIVAGCVALHMRGKHNTYYLFKLLLNTVMMMQRYFQCLIRILCVCYSMRVVVLYFKASCRSTYTQTRVPFQMGIKIHVENAEGCVGVHGLTCTVQQLSAFVHACAL